MRFVYLAFACSTLLAAQSARSGLDVGSRIPQFALQDQNGKTRTFESIRGEKGAVLVFYRSADW